MLDFQFVADFCTAQRIPFQREEPLCKHTTFKIGGPAPLLICPESAAQFESAAAFLLKSGTPFFLLGNGSNLLFLDEGYHGVVLAANLKRPEITLAGDDCIRAESGATLSSVCGFAREHSLSGLEFAFGIPGSVGGAVYMNAGAYGGQISDVFESAEYLDETGTKRTITKAEMGFGYRKSFFSGKRLPILSATFRLCPGRKEEISKAMKEFYARRKEKQPLEYPSAGSVFKRPEGAFAGALIEQCGLKGTAVGGAMVSEKHAGFIINTGGATCEDVTQLISLIQRTVKERTGYTLECEVMRIGKE